MAKNIPKNIPAEVEALIKTTVESAGITLWNVELEKEGSGLNLLVTIDKDDGITINDCAEITRLIDPMLDEADPIPTSYCLEVSSVGTERALRRAEHYDYAIRTALPCNIKFFAPIDGVKELCGILKAYDDQSYTFEIGGEEKVFPKKIIAKLYILHQVD
ncbi:MAG: ribosome maturation factor RimP [Clostridia bacterium]|nr:ribosome maturation factor RimP [Clostridia bacterium]